MKEVRFYLDKETGLWIRATKKRIKFEHYPGEHKEWTEWKPFDKLFPRHQEKLALLLMLPDTKRVEQSLEGIGMRRDSRAHKGLAYFKLCNEAWRKEL
jgi:ribosomal protein L13